MRRITLVVASSFVAGDLGREREAIDIGHQRVGQHQVERLSAAGGLAQRRERGRRAVHRHGAHLPACENLRENEAIGRVVVDDEHAEVAKVDGWRGEGRRRLPMQAEVGDEMEAAALADFALDPDPARPSTPRAVRKSSSRVRCPHSASWWTYRPARTRRRCSSSLSCGMPMPVSVTRNRRVTSSAVSRSTATSRITSPLSVNLIAFPTRLRITCRSRPGSPTTASGTSGAMRHASSSPFLGGAGRQQLDAVFHRVAEVERCPIEREAPGVDLRHVEDVVDDRQQRLGGLSGRADVVALLSREPGVEREVRHADDRVHRRADLVAHVRQELAFGHRRLLGALACDLELLDELRETAGVLLLLELGALHLLRVHAQRLLGGLALGDVARGRVDEPLFGSGADVHCSHLYDPSRERYRFSKSITCSPRRQRRERVGRGGAVVRVDEVHERRRAELGLREAEHALPCGIEPDEVAVEGAPRRRGRATA